MKISVIIPTYKTPDALSLCLKSAIEGQVNRNEIIVVVDGTYKENEQILLKYKEDIKILNLPQNVGTCKATNLGVYNSNYSNILITNDDNVFPKNWDIKLGKYDINDSVISPNQIEPYPSIFPQFFIEDLGRNPKTFDLEKYYQYCLLCDDEYKDNTGSTFPIYISKFNYMRIGGFAEDYPSPSGYVSDWEFFMKCQLCGMKMERVYDVNFYHFVSLSTKTPQEIQKSQQYEKDCHEYAKYKWGKYINHDPQTNLKYL